MCRLMKENKLVCPFGPYARFWLSLSVIICNYSCVSSDSSVSQHMSVEVLKNSNVLRQTTAKSNKLKVKKTFRHFAEIATHKISTNTHTHQNANAFAKAVTKQDQMEYQRFPNIYSAIFENQHYQESPGWMRVT